MTVHHAHAPQPVTAYFVYGATGFLGLFVILMPAGYADPVSIGGFVALVAGQVILALVAAPLALFFDRVAAATASVAVLAGAVSAVLFVNAIRELDSVWVALFIMVLFAPTAFVAGLGLRCVRFQETPRRKRPQKVLRGLLTMFPYAIFFFVFSGVNILGMLLRNRRTP